MIVLSRFLSKMVKHLKIKYRLLVYLSSFTVCSGDTLKKSSEDDQSTDHFQSGFFSSAYPKSDLKKSHKSTNKKFWPLNSVSLVGR